MVALALLTVLRYLMERGPTPVDEPERPDLVPWDLTGCWDLEVGPWQPEGAGAPKSASPAGAAFVVPPTRVMLVADSIDPSGRASTTYRAVPMAGDHDDRLRDYLRWLVRADTLWLLWSDRSSGAGIALLSHADSLVGRARSFGDGGALDATARAVAWKINCSSLYLDRRRTGPRR